MRTLLFGLVISAAVACGGKASPAPASDGDGDGARVAAGTTTPPYCEDYRGCAEERERMDRDAMNDEDLTADQRAEIAAGVTARIESCTGTYNSLTPHQQAWLESCTGCGGSCDVYDCLDQAPQISEDQEFECDQGDGGGDEEQ